MNKVRYGFWMPIFGGWLRNVDDEQMHATFDYNKRLAQRAEQIGFDITLLAELNLNDIKGATAPVLECWTTAAAIASVTEKVELMNAIRPGFRLPAITAKMAANIDQISNGRLASTSSLHGGNRRWASTEARGSATISATSAPANLS